MAAQLLIASSSTPVLPQMYSHSESEVPPAVQLVKHESWALQNMTDWHCASWLQHDDARHVKQAPGSDRHATLPAQTPALSQASPAQQPFPQGSPFREHGVGS